MGHSLPWPSPTRIAIEIEIEIEIETDAAGSRRRLRPEARRMIARIRFDRDPALLVAAALS